eukprot:SAG31_NODE_4727_length_3001_cov_3.721916_3_plen_93_part_00
MLQHRARSLLLYGCVRVMANAPPNRRADPCPHVLNVVLARTVYTAVRVGSYFILLLNLQLVVVSGPPSWSVGSEGGCKSPEFGADASAGGLG